MWNNCFVMLCNVWQYAEAPRVRLASSVYVRVRVSWFLHTMSTALILGATGATGRHLLRELLSNDQWSKVGEYGRRVTPENDLPENRGKLEQKTINFENLDAAGLKDGRWDVVFVTLGTTRAKAGSAEMFEKIDRE
jgi:oxidoreductase